MDASHESGSDQRRPGNGLMTSTAIMAAPSSPPTKNTFGIAPPDPRESLASTTAPDQDLDETRQMVDEWLDQAVGAREASSTSLPEDEPIPEEHPAEYEDHEDFSYKGTESPDTPALGQPEPPNPDQTRWVWNPDSQDFVFTKDDGTKLLYTVYQRQHDLKNNDKPGKPLADAKPRRIPLVKAPESDDSYEKVSENPDSRSGLSSISSRDRPPYEEPLNKQFQIVKKPGRFFSPGRIFKTPWFEPDNPNGQGQPADHEWRDACPPWHGTKPHAKFRWFVVVRRRASHTLCFCITTFGGPGAARDRRDNPKDFVVLHKAEIPPPPPYEEEGITRGPLKVIIEKGEQYISPLARLDCGRVYTVENNLRVLKIGRIHPDSLPALEQYFKDSMLA